MWPQFRYNLFSNFYSVEVRGYNEKLPPCIIDSVLLIWEFNKEWEDIKDKNNIFTLYASVASPYAW